MPANYKAIRAENKRRYGTDIDEVGRELLANRYDNRTHFIYEVLQNAEDALTRRPEWSGSHAVTFELSSAELRISHFGIPFTKADVKGICGILKSTKGRTEIGRFGIGFKSFYAYTDRPEVHSDDEHFAIESFVWPTALPKSLAQAGQTVILLPFRADDSAAVSEITAGLRQLGPGALLFLREIEEISWSVPGGASGQYLRSQPEWLADSLRKVVIRGEESATGSICEETWLVFSREVSTIKNEAAGYVEIAFALEPHKDDGFSVRPTSNSPLVVFFPTILETNLGFLAQGPYKTTPSRDNVPRDDDWNKYLVCETAELVVEGVRALKDMGLLDAKALHCLPLDRAKFWEGNMFTPIFDKVREALSEEPLLPCFDARHISAHGARLGRTQELRELFSPQQLADILEAQGNVAWLSGDITERRTPELYRYLMKELGIDEITPETIAPKLNQAFLEAQSDEWIVKLYSFLNGQPAILRYGWLDDLPLVRLENGRHIAAEENGHLQAFLPGLIETDFPTVRRAVCKVQESREFLMALGLSEPDPVDDVIRNILPTYAERSSQVDAARYAVDIERILAAFATDSKAQREKLLGALRESHFVGAVDSGTGAKQTVRPRDVYRATERLKELFEGLPGILLVDDSIACLQGEVIRKLFEACGASRYLRPIDVPPPHFTHGEKRKMRIEAGCESYNGYEGFRDHTLHGLDALLDALPKLDAETLAKKAMILWNALADLESRGSGVFSGTYSWSYHYSRSAAFDAQFMQKLNSTSWVPNARGELQRPGFVVFDTLGWKPNPFLQSKIRFKPAIIDTLAKEAGFEPAALDLLKELGVTSEAELIERLGISRELKPDDGESGGTVDEALKGLLGDTPGPTPPTPTPDDPEPGGTGGGRPGRTGHGGIARPGRGSGSAKRTPGSSGGRPFISYVGAHPSEEESDHDGLDHAARMALEEQAISLIIEAEPQLERTPTHNPGYDLFERGRDGEPNRWVEVKAMTGDLHGRAVGLSAKQFEMAMDRHDRYWIYVVEFAGSSEARVVRIQNPAGKARTYTFDQGWLSIAEVEAARHTAQFVEE